MKGMRSTRAVVLDEHAVVPDQNRITPPPNQFTHKLTRPQSYYFNGAQQGRPPDGELPAHTQVVLLVYDEGASYCRVADARGLYVELEHDSLQQL